MTTPTAPLAQIAAAPERVEKDVMTVTPQDLREFADSAAAYLETRQTCLAAADLVLLGALGAQIVALPGFAGPPALAGRICAELFSFGRKSRQAA